MEAVPALHKAVRAQPHTRVEQVSDHEPALADELEGVGLPKSSSKPPSTLAASSVPSSAVSIDEPDTAAELDRVHLAEQAQPLEEDPG